MNGLGPDAPVVTNSRGAKQSDTPSRADLLPPAALLHIGAILKAGAAKYGEQNWRELDLADHINHAYVHILAFLDGDTQDDHLGHAACRMLFALETQLKAPPCMANVAVEPETINHTPCCNYQVPLAEPGPIYWNTYNKVVQCHNCGHIYNKAVHV